MGQDVGALATRARKPEQDHARHQGRPAVGPAVARVAAAGLLLEKEMDYFRKSMAEPVRPLVAVIGGAKVSTKLAALENMLGKVDRMIIGGAIGNIIDRLRQGAVTDFLDFYWRDWHWPTFNVADIAITLGAVLILAASLPLRRRKEPVLDQS